MRRCIIIASLIIMGCLWLSISPAFGLPDGAVARLGKGDIAYTDRSVAFSADGSRVAVATTIGIYIYDSLTHQEIGLVETNAYATCVAFSPDGRLIASGHIDEISVPSTVKLWDASSLQEVATLIGEYLADVSSVAFSPDSLLLAAADDSGRARLWDVTSFQQVAVFEARLGHINSVAFSPDGQLLATGSDVYTSTESGVKLWGVPSLEEVATLAGHRGDVNSVAFSPDGHFLAAGGSDTKLWDTSSFQEVASLAHLNAVKSVAFSPDGHFLAAGGSDTKLWDTSSFQEVAALVVGHSGEIHSVAFSLDGHLLATRARSYKFAGSGDNNVKLWSVPSLEEVATLIEGSSPISYSALSPDGQLLATAPSEFTSAGTTVVLWDVPRRQVMATLTGRRFTTSLAFSPDGRLLASGSDQGGLSWNAQVTFWDMETLQEVATLTGHSRTIRSLAFSPDGRLLASSSFNMVKLWDVSSLQEVATLTSQLPGQLYSVEWFNSVAFSPDGRLLAGAGFQRVILWDVSSLQRVATLDGYSWDVNSVAFSPDGLLLATGDNGDNDTIKLWDASSLQKVATFTGNANSANSVVFSPDGSVLAAGMSDYTVKLCDIATQQEIATLTGHGQNIKYVAFSSNNRLLASASVDNTALLWDMTPYVSELPNQPPSLRFSPSPPYIVSVGSNIIITVTADDMDGDECIITADALPLNAEFSDNILTFSPSADQVGEHRIVFQADDQSGGIDTETIEITVKAPPVVSDIPDQSIEEGETFAAIALGDYVSDPDNEESEIAWTYSGNVELSVSINDASTATITVPDPEWNGSEAIAFTATDPCGLSDSQSVTFTVIPVPDPLPTVDLGITSVEAAPGSSAIVQISISDATGMASGDMVIKYDASMIAVDEVTATNLLSGILLIPNIDVPGEIRLSMAGASGIPEGSGALMEIGLTVSADAKAGTETPLSFEAATIYDETGTTIPVKLESGVVRILGIKGDVNKDGKVSAADATLTLRIAAELMIPNDYQKWAADMNDDGKVRTNDVILILRIASGLAAPRMDISPSIASEVSITFAEESHSPNERMTIPLAVDNVRDLAGGDICIAYNHKMLRAINILTDSDLLATIILTAERCCIISC